MRHYWMDRNHRIDGQHRSPFMVILSLSKGRTTNGRPFGKLRKGEFMLPVALRAAGAHPHPGRPPQEEGTIARTW